MVAPLAVLGLVLSRKKKRGKWDTFIAVLFVCVVVGMSVSACGPTSPPLIPDEAPTSTLPVPTETETEDAAGTATNKGTSTPPPPSDLAGLDDPCIDKITATSDLVLLEKPTMPEGLLDSGKIAWDTYIDLWNITEYKHPVTKKMVTPWWWFEGYSGVASFTSLDFLDRLLQFEFYSLSEPGSEYAEEIAVGNFCFWTTRNDDLEQTHSGRSCTIKDETIIFNYIGKRGLVDRGKNYTSSNMTAWRAPEWDPEVYEIEFVNAFKNPEPSWLDWRNAGTPYYAEDDVPVEWGNKVSGNQDAFYFLVNGKRKGMEIGSKTNQVFLDQDTFYAFTFCQKVFYDNPKTGAYNEDMIANCGDPSHWSY